jgi:hypothetical protein
MATETKPDALAEAEAKLEAIRARRAAKAAAREAARQTADANRKAELEAKEEANDEIFAKLEDEHGRGSIKRINIKSLGEMVVVKQASPMVHRRFSDEHSRSDHPNPKVRVSFHDACERMVRHCLVHPDQAMFDSLAKQSSGLIGVAANEAYSLGLPQVEEDTSK